MVRPRWRQASSRRVSGRSAPSSAWAASISPRRSEVSASEKRMGSPGAEVDPVAAHQRPGGQQRQRLGLAERVGRRRQAELLARQGGGVLGGHGRLEGLEGLLEQVGLVEEGQRAGRQVVGQRDQAAGVEAGQERLLPEEGGPLLDGVEHLAHPRGGPVDLLGAGPHRLAGRRLPLLGEERLARRAGEHRHRRAPLDAPLGLRDRRRAGSRSRRRRTRAGPARPRPGSTGRGCRRAPRRCPGPPPAGRGRSRAR